MTHKEFRSAFIALYLAVEETGLNRAGTLLETAMQYAGSRSSPELLQKLQTMTLLELWELSGSLK